RVPQVRRTLPGARAHRRGRRGRPARPRAQALRLASRRGAKKALRGLPSRIRAPIHEGQVRKDPFPGEGVHEKGVHEVSVTPTTVGYAVLAVGVLLALLLVARDRRGALLGVLLALGAFVLALRWKAPRELHRAIPQR